MIEIVAEIGLNHNGDLSLAKHLIETAAKCGCDWVKFQKRTPELCVPEHMRDVPRETPWGTMSYMDYRHRVELSEDSYDRINLMCEKAGIKWFGSAFDLGAVEFLVNKCPYNRVKIPSAKITNLDLLAACSNHFDEVIISTAMSVEHEIEMAVDLAEPTHILHCHAAYPAPDNELNLTYIQHLAQKFPRARIGYSGHEYGLVTTFAAVALGAEMVERHITIDRTLWGSDQSSSVEPDGLEKLVRGIRTIEQSLERQEGFLANHGRVLWPSEEKKRNQLRG